MSSKITRRQAIGSAGAAGAGLALAGVTSSWGPVGRLVAAGTAAAAPAAACTVVTPEKETGPYFVDALLNRSDVRTDSSTGVAQAGIPLALTLYLYADDDDCTPYQGAVVDIWNANAAGVYSDEASENTTGTDYLRGYQVTDANGMVAFTTNMPGWYSGRSMHVHVRIRTFDGATDNTFSWYTQLFFGESIDSAVAAVAPYATADTNRPRVIDTNDRVWKDDADGTETDDGLEVTVTLSGDVTSGYTGSFGIALNGLPSTNTADTGLETGTTTTTTTTTSTSTSTSTSSGSTGATGDKVVSAALKSFHWNRTKAGGRTLVLGMVNGEIVDVGVKLMRGKRVLARKASSRMRRGNRKLELSIATYIAKGNANLELTLKDVNANTKRINRTISIPAHENER